MHPFIYYTEPLFLSEKSIHLHVALPLKIMIKLWSNMNVYILILAQLLRERGIEIILKAMLEYVSE